MEQIPNKTPIPEGNAMYFDTELARAFAELEQNEKHRSVAETIARVALYTLGDLSRPWHIAELGGGAHPDRYAALFSQLQIQPKGTIDWVDLSPIMLSLAEEYLEKEGLMARKSVLTFIEEDLFDYLEHQPDQSLDLILLKYVAAYLNSTAFERMVILSRRKLKPGASLVATYGFPNPAVPSKSTNARFSLNGSLIPEGQTVPLHHGDRVDIQFFNVSGQPDKGLMPGANTIHYYQAPDWLMALAKTHDLDCFVGDWKAYLPTEHHEDETKEQSILVLTCPR